MFILCTVQTDNMFAQIFSSPSSFFLMAVIVLCVLQTAALAVLFSAFRKRKHRQDDLSRNLQLLKNQVAEMDFLLKYIADLGKITYISGRMYAETPEADPLFKFILHRSESLLPEDKEEYLNQYRKFFSGQVRSFSFNYSVPVNGRLKQLCDYASFSDLPESTAGSFAIATVDISELAKHTSELANTDTLLTAIFDNLPGYIVMKNISSDFAYLRCNNAFSSLLQMHPSEVAGKTDFDLFPPALARRIRFFDMQIAANHSIADNQWFFTTPNGKEHAMRFISRPLKRPDGSEIIIGFGIDTTRQDRLVGKLRRRNKELRLLLAGNNNYSMLLDSSLHLACATPAMQRSFPPELQETDSPPTCRDICSCNITDSTLCPAQQAVASGKTHWCKYAKITDRILSVKPLLNENNSTTYLAVSIADDSETLEAENIDV